MLVILRMLGMGFKMKRYETGWRKSKLSPKDGTRPDTMSPWMSLTFPTSYFVFSQPWNIIASTHYADTGCSRTARKLLVLSKFLAVRETKCVLDDLKQSCIAVWEGLLWYHTTLNHRPCLSWGTRWTMGQCLGCMQKTALLHLYCRMRKVWVAPHTFCPVSFCLFPLYLHIELLNGTLSPEVEVQEQLMYSLFLFVYLFVF